MAEVEGPHHAGEKIALLAVQFDVAAVDAQMRRPS